MTRISVIVTSFNHGGWLRAAIESVLSQNWPATEVVIADDGSTDGSREAIRSIAAANSIVRPILRERNLGVAANRDLAVRDATSELVTTLDGDDLYLPGKLAAEMHALEDAPTGAIAFSSFTRINASGETIGEAVFDEPVFEHAVVNRVRRVLMTAPIPRDMLIPKLLYEHAGGLSHDLPMYEDLDLKLRLARDAAKWVNSGATGTKHRHHHSGLTGVDSLEHLRWNLEVIWRNRTWMEQIIGPDEFHAAVSKLCARKLRRAAARLSA